MLLAVVLSLHHNCLYVVPVTARVLSHEEWHQPTAVISQDFCKILGDEGDLSADAALRGRGYDKAALKKLAHENWTRVLRET